MSISAYPAFGREGFSNGVTYKITIAQSDGRPTEGLATASEYSLQVVCQSDGEPGVELNIILPVGFELLSQQSSEQSWYSSQKWAHYYKVRSPAQAGIYTVYFNGKDEKSREFNFTVSLPIVEDLTAYNAKEAKEQAIRERSVVLPEGQTIIFPKGFESEGKKPFYSTIIGGVIGTASTLYAIKDNKIVVVVPVAAMVVMGGAVVGGYLGAQIDNAIYKNTEIGWLKEKNEHGPELIAKKGDIICTLYPSPLFSSPSGERNIGKVEKAEFRRILGSSTFNNLTLYKVKVGDTPLFD